MNQNERYEEAKKRYEAVGVDTDAAISKLKEIPVSLHCWQGDDVIGFDHDGPLTGGIQTTGDYPGKARTPEELMQDMDQALKLMPGRKKLNLHASYAIFEKGEFVDLTRRRGGSGSSTERRACASRSILRRRPACPA